MCGGDGGGGGESKRVLENNFQNKKSKNIFCLLRDVFSIEFLFFILLNDEKYKNTF